MSDCDHPDCPAGLCHRYLPDAPADLHLRQSNIRYIKVYHCVSCKNRLTRDEVYNSHGLCPLCGHKNPVGSFISEVVETAKAVKVYEPRPKTRAWWNLWGWLPW